MRHGTGVFSGGRPAQRRSRGAAAGRLDYGFFPPRPGAAPTGRFAGALVELGTATARSRALRRELRDKPVGSLSARAMRALQALGRWASTSTWPMARGDPSAGRCSPAQARRA